MSSAFLRPFRLYVSALAAAAAGIFAPIPAAGWTSPSLLNSTGASDAGHDFYPQTVSTGNGTWVAVWQTRQTSLGGSTSAHAVAFSRSFDDGASWSSAQPLHEKAKAASGDMQYPQVAADGLGNLVAVWGRLSGTVVGRVLTSRSSDYGATWSTPADLLSDETGADPRTRIATDGQGLWIAVWANNTGVRYARSLDNGQTWTAPGYLSSSSNKGAIPDIQTDSRGIWIVTWTKGSSTTDNDIVCVRSTDHGVTWGDTRFLNDNANSDSTHEWMPRLATDGRGNWIAAWQLFQGGLTYCRSTNNGAEWGAPVFLSTTFNGSNPPAISTDRSGNWILVWESIVSSSRIDLFVSTSANVGVSWSSPQFLVTAAPYNSAVNVAPVVAANGFGKWLASWYALTVPTNPNGTDADLYSATLNLATSPRARLAARQQVRIKANFGGYQEMVYHYGNQSLVISPYSAADGAVSYPLPFEGWAGVYHYDYSAGRFTQALYQGTDELR